MGANWKRGLSKLTPLTVILVLFPTAAHANVGLPMIMLVWPLLWLAIVPIIFIEWWVMKKTISNLPPRQLFYTVSLSNTLSSFVGVPIIWMGLVLIEGFTPGGTGTYPSLNLFWRSILSVTLQAPWLLPYQSELYWMVPTALLVLMIPFFFMSYWVESWVSIMLIKCMGEKTLSRQTIKQSVWEANKYSYLFLASLGVLTTIPPMGSLLNIIPSFIKAPISYFVNWLLTGAFQ